MEFENKTTSHSHAFETAEVDLHQIYNLLKINRWFIASIMAICLLLSILYLVFKAPIYSANVLLQIEDKSNMVGLGSTPEKIFGGKNIAPEQDIQSVLIKSRYILNPVIQKLGLDMTIQPSYFPIIGAWYAHHHADKNKASTGWLSHYAWGGEKLAISEFTIPEESNNRHFTLVALADQGYELYQNKQLILQGKVGELVKADIPGLGKYTINVTQLNAHPNTHFSIYKKPIQQFVKNLTQQIVIKDLASDSQMTEKTGIIQVSLQGYQPSYIVNILNTIANVLVEKNIEKKTAENTKTLTFLNQQLPIIKKSLDDAEIALNEYTAKSGTINLTEAERILLQQIADSQKNLEEAKIARSIALQKYTTLNPAVIEIDQKINGLQQEIKDLNKKASELPLKGQESISLMREIKVKSQLYLMLLNRIQSMQVTKAGAVSDVRVLNFATVPENPDSTNHLLIMLGSLCAGFVLGCAIVFIRHALHNKLSDPVKMEEALGIPNMAIIPYSAKQQKITEQNNSKVVILPFLAQKFPHDISVEALRSFRTSLQFVQFKAPNNIVTITGVAPNTGKSFISANIAYLLAQSGKKVLLIDGDIRKGHLKNYFRVGACKGLTEVVMGECTFEQALLTGANENLHFLPSGAYPPNPSELLMSDEFKALLDEVSTKYDLVIIDTAPILAVTDSVIIMQHSGTNFLVVAAHQHDISEVQLALKRFAMNGIKINGTIFNFKDEQKGLYRTQVYNYNYQYKY